MVAQSPSESPPPLSARSKSDNRFALVDSLRGIAALWVVLDHAHLGHHLGLLEAQLPPFLKAVISSGRLGVAIFFVLSGFVIAHSVSQYSVDARFMGRFILRRAIRLDIPYWFSMLLVVGFAYLSSRVVADKVFVLPSVPAVAAHVVYLQELLGFEHISMVYWTLCYEFQFYLIFIVLMTFVNRPGASLLNRTRLLVVFVPCMILAAYWPLYAKPFAVPDGLFLNLWYGFLLGATAYWAQRRSLPASLFLAYAVAISVGSLWNANAFGVMCAAASTLLFTAGRLDRLSVWLRNRWLLFLGMISYSLYLTHMPITGAFYNVARRVWTGSVAADVVWLVVMIAVNIAFSALFWFIFERAALRLSHKVRLGRSKVQGTGGSPSETMPASTISMNGFKSDSPQTVA